MHTFWHTTVVKHEAWILINQFVRQKDRRSLPCSLQIWFQRLCSQAHVWFADSVRGLECDWSQISCGVRHSEEWHHSLEKVKDKKSFLKPLKKFKILFVLFFFLFISCWASSFNPDQFSGEEVARDFCVLLLGCSVYSAYTWYSVCVYAYI